MKPAVKVGIVTTVVAVALTLIALIFAIVVRSGEGSGGTAGADPQTPLVRDGSQILDQGGPGAVTVVEFLDFECEACGAFFPVVEDLREKYDGEITYVVRYFPLPGHLNAENAALAAESAAQQGRFEDMYRLLFETQAQWGEATASKAGLFRDYAEQLGLDMTAYDRSIADPATVDRIAQDLGDGQRLGVDSTPTFYVGGEELSVQKIGDLEDAVRAAVNG